MRQGLLCVLAFVLALSPAWAMEVKGRVFEDTNANGKLEKGERGLASVAVSDGRAIVLTDSEGKFSLDVAPDPVKGLCFVFVVKPSGWAPTNGWYRRLEELESGKEVLFGLKRVREDQNFFFVHVSDIHVTGPGSKQAKMFKEFVTEVNELLSRAAFVLSTGDQVMAGHKDELDAFCQVAKGLKLPLFCVVGNHDLRDCIVPICRKYDLERPEVIFERIKHHPELSSAPHRAITEDGLWRLPYMDALGPCWYSFDYADWHIIVLDAHAFLPLEGKFVVSSDFEEVQLEWLERDLEVCGKGKPLIVAWHEPGHMWEEVMGKFRGYDLRLVLVGHTHTNCAGRIGKAWFIQTASLSDSGGYQVFFVRGREPVYWLWKELGKKPFLGLWEMGGRHPSEAYFAPPEKFFPLIDTTATDEAGRIGFKAYIYPVGRVEEVRFRVDNGEWAKVEKVWRDADFEGLFWAEGHIEMKGLPVGLHYLEMEAEADGKVVRSYRYPFVKSSEQRECLIFDDLKPERSGFRIAHPCGWGEGEAVVDREVKFSGEESLKIVVRGSGGGGFSFCGGHTSLPPCTEGEDVYLEFYLKAGEGEAARRIGVTFSLGARSFTAAENPFYAFEPDFSQANPDGWVKVVIPLRKFENAEWLWKHRFLSHLVFVSWKPGTFWVDRISLVRRGD